MKYLKQKMLKAPLKMKCEKSEMKQRLKIKMSKKSKKERK